MSGVSPETLGTEAMDSETAIINPAAGAAKKPGKKLSIIKHLSPRAIIQVFLTVLALGIYFLIENGFIKRGLGLGQSRGGLQMKCE